MMAVGKDAAAPLGPFENAAVQFLGQAFLADCKHGAAVAQPGLASPPMAPSMRFSVGRTK